MTYTFIRALHMMRYCDAKMRLEKWTEIHYLRIIDGRIVETNNNGKEFFGALLSSRELLGNWIEVKDEE